MKSGLAVLAVAMSLVFPAIAPAAHHKPGAHATKKHHTIKAHSAAMSCRTRAC